MWDWVGDEADVVGKRRGLFHDQFRRQNFHRHPDLGIHPAEPVENEGQIVGAETLT